MSILEIIAMTFTLICVYLTSKQNIWCWATGIVGVIAFLIIGFFFLALPEKGYSGVMPLGGCCISEPGCIEFSPDDGLILCVGGSLISGGVCTQLGPGGQCVEPPAPAAVPTLSEWGLLAMAGILGIVGFMVMRRRKVTA